MDAFEATPTDAPTIKPDHWHHAALSLDLQKNIKAEGKLNIGTFADCPSPHTATVVTNQDVQKVTNPAKVHIALDDVHYNQVCHNGKDYADFVKIGNNEIGSNVSYDAATAANAAVLHDKSWAGEGLVDLRDRSSNLGLPTYMYTPKGVPKGPFGIPCTSDLIDSVYYVEMGEFQMWLDKTLDTSKEENRRIFIDDKGKPVKPAVAKEFFGREPDVMLHGSGNWIKGLNTGSTGIDENGEIITDGQFVPKAGIARYKPNPSLHGPQKPGEKKIP